MYVTENTNQSLDLVAQLVEQRTFNAWVLGSNPNEVNVQCSLPVVNFLKTVSNRTPQEYISWLKNLKNIKNLKNLQLKTKNSRKII